MAYYNASELAALANKYAAKQTDAENKRRKENGRQPNVSHEFEEADTEVLFRSTETTGDKSHRQPTRFGGYLGGFA